MKKLLAMVVIVGFVFAGEPKITIKFPLKVGLTHPRTTKTQEFAKWVEKYSNGAIKVEVYPGSQLYKTKEGLQALSMGGVEMMNPPNGHLVAYSKLYELIELPFLFKTNEDFWSFLYSPAGWKIIKSAEKSNVIGLTAMDEGPMIIATKDRFLKRPEDFKGMKIRTSGHPIVEDAIRTFGGSTVRLPLGEVYTAAQQGVVNGVYTTFTAYLKHHLYEVLPYVTLFPNHGAYVWVASKQWWDKLPNYYKYIIQTGAMRCAAEYDVEVWSGLDSYIKKLKAHGGHYYAPTPEDLKTLEKAFSHNWKKYEKKYGVFFKDVLKAAKGG